MEPPVELEGKAGEYTVAGFEISGGLVRRWSASVVLADAENATGGEPVVRFRRGSSAHCAAQGQSQTVAPRDRRWGAGGPER